MKSHLDWHGSLQEPKTPAPGMSSHALSCWSELVKRLPKYYMLLLLSLFVSQRWEVSSFR